MKAILEDALGKRSEILTNDRTRKKMTDGEKLDLVREIFHISPDPHEEQPKNGPNLLIIQSFQQS